jgi:hypothetical protein
VDDIDAGTHGFAEILVIGAGPAMEGEEDAGGLFDGGDSVDVQVLSGFALDHALEHAVHISDRGSENVHTGTFDELLRLLWSRQAMREVGGRLVYLGAGANVADFAFDEHGWVYGLQVFDGLFGLADVLFEGQRRKVEDNRVKAGFGCIESLG